MSSGNDGGDYGGGGDNMKPLFCKNRSVTYNELFEYDRLPLHSR